MFLVKASPLVTAGEAEVFLPSNLVHGNLKQLEVSVIFKSLNQSLKYACLRIIEVIFCSADGGEITVSLAGIVKQHEKEMKKMTEALISVEQDREVTSSVITLAVMSRHRAVSTYCPFFIRISDKRLKSLRFVWTDSLQSHLFRNSSYVSLTFPWWSLRGLNCVKHTKQGTDARRGFKRCQDRIEKLITGLFTGVNPPQIVSHQGAC